MDAAELARLDAELGGYLARCAHALPSDADRLDAVAYLEALLRADRAPDAVALARCLESAHPLALGARLRALCEERDWPDEPLRARAARQLEAGAAGPWTLALDDTGIIRQGPEWVGVGWQHLGTQNRLSHCQVLVTLHLCGARASAAIGSRLYLPEAWASDRPRRRAHGVPEAVPFRRKWELALELLHEAHAWELGARVVVADAGYGDASEFRDRIAELGLGYLVGVGGAHRGWPAEAVAGEPQQLAELSRRLSYRELRAGRARARLASMRVRLGEYHHKGAPPSGELLLLAEWPSGERGPTAHWLARLPGAPDLEELWRLARLLERPARDQRELIRPLGLDAEAGRSWRGLHHHAALCMAAQGLLALSRGPARPASATG